jgi:hypothetical protein
VDLVLNEGLSLQEAVAEAREKATLVKETSVDQVALDAAAAKGFGNARFEYDEDEISQAVEEFYPATADESSLDNSSVMSELRKKQNSARSAAV